MKRRLALLTLALAFAAPAVRAQSFVPVRDWDVYVDLPTRFAYVKTPLGWKYIRQLDEAQMAQLPPSTLIALLAPEQPEIRWAHPALEESPRLLAQRTAQTRVAGVVARPAAQQ